VTDGPAADRRAGGVTEPDVLVVGAGVIGLTSAVCLAEAGLRVRIVAAEPPQQTTSRVAGALWGASFMQPAAEVGRWLEVSREELRALAERPETGVRVAGGILASRWSEGPPPPEIFPGARFEERDPPAGFVGAYRAEVPVLDMPRYLDYLVARLEAAGVPIEVRAIATLADAAAQAPAIVNCTGVGARELASDPSLQAVRGQHVVVENPGIEDFFVEEQRESVWAGFFPHGPRVVLGGVATPDDWSLEPDPAIAAGIVERCAAIEPRLRGAPVLEHQVGLRPVRPAVRLEEEAIGRARCVHNYGHGGSGVSLSWGCARAVQELLA
jgi:D-amino-acid oxidase